MNDTIDLLLGSPVEVVYALLPDIVNRRLSSGEARRRIDANPGLVPLAIEAGDLEAGSVFWADLSDHDIQEWQLAYSLEEAVRRGAVRDHFITPLEVLRHPPSDQVIEPTGFIFHMSRCGSTLVSRALAQSPRNLVQSQPGVLRDGIWSALTNGWTTQPAGTDLQLDFFRNLLAHLMRGSAGNIDGRFIKFYSENVLFLEFVRQAFPTTPCLFLFRDPVEVLASVAKNSTGMLAARGTERATFISGLEPTAAATTDDQGFIMSCFRRYFEVVLAARPGGLTILDYRRLRADYFPAIVADAFDYRLPAADRRAILDQFGLYSKAKPGEPIPYQDDSARKRESLTETDRLLAERELGPLLDRLRAREWLPTSPTDAPEIGSGG